ncbi:hypothetical protein EA187_00870 [Lujinxingia sediminis]|uniref:Uncharacterized protein n=1 Tax=Lujinxingia sediminis TaxID=2480984 RepID=A0ABY0CVX1_9DELT|nr:hypothetical protein [Lujinxingia sediminis]RVU48018.1 hypothetical protein EA187_00870 [Lujinxingia sediminis]
MSATSPTELPFLLWRTHRSPDGQRFPEVIATDGHTICRVGTLDRQIYLQRFEARDAAQNLVQRIEAGLTRQHAVIGYSMMQDDDPVAIRVTGSPEDPGWLAFPDRGALPPELRPPDARTTLPALARDLPQRRLVAGASTRRGHTSLTLLCAIEERGTASTLAILPHLTAISLVATRPDAGAPAELALGRRPPQPSTRNRASAHRLDLSFELPNLPATELLAAPSVRFWLRLELSSDLLCLPARWRTFDLEIRPDRRP